MSIRYLCAARPEGPVRALLIDMDGVMFDTENRSIALIIDVIARQGLTITREFIIPSTSVTGVRRSA